MIYDFVIDIREEMLLILRNREAEKKEMALSHGAAQIVYDLKS